MRAQSILLPGGSAAAVPGTHRGGGPSEALPYPYLRESLRLLPDPSCEPQPLNGPSSSFLSPSASDLPSLTTSSPLALSLGSDASPSVSPADSDSPSDSLSGTKNQSEKGPNDPCGNFEATSPRVPSGSTFRSTRYTSPGHLAGVPEDSQASGENPSEAGRNIVKLSSSSSSDSSTVAEDLLAPCAGCADVGEHRPRIPESPGGVGGAPCASPRLGSLPSFSRLRLTSQEPESPSAAKSAAAARAGAVGASPQIPPLCTDFLLAVPCDPPSEMGVATGVPSPLGADLGLHGPGHLSAEGPRCGHQFSPGLRPANNIFASSPRTVNVASHQSSSPVRGRPAGLGLRASSPLKMKQAPEKLLSASPRTMRRGPGPHASLKRKRPPMLEIPAKESFTASPTSSPGLCQFEVVEDVKEVEADGAGFAVYCKRGRRREVMEDRYQAVNGLGGKKDTAYFGVFDGHGGKMAAEFAAQQLHLSLADALQKGRGAEASLGDAYMDTDARFLKQSQPSGTTCVTCLVTGDRVVIGHAGDCRAVVAQKGKAVAITSDHKASREDERKRIEDIGGHVDCFSGTWRIQGVMAVTRGIGDQYLKEYITPVPETTAVELNDKDGFIILASDGLWDVVSNEEAVAIVSEAIGEETGAALLRPTDHRTSANLNSLHSAPPPSTRRCLGSSGLSARFNQTAQAHAGPSTPSAAAASDREAPSGVGEASTPLAVAASAAAASDRDGPHGAAEAPTPRPVGAPKPSFRSGSLSGSDSSTAKSEDTSESESEGAGEASGSGGGGGSGVPRSRPLRASLGYKRASYSEEFVRRGGYPIREAQGGGYPMQAPPPPPSLAHSLSIDYPALAERTALSSSESSPRAGLPLTSFPRSAPGAEPLRVPARPRSGPIAKSLGSFPDATHHVQTDHVQASRFLCHARTGGRSEELACTPRARDRGLATLAMRLKATCKCLAELAVKRGSNDDVTVMIVVPSALELQRA